MKSFAKILWCDFKESWELWFAMIVLFLVVMYSALARAGTEICYWNLALVVDGKIFAVVKPGNGTRAEMRKATDMAEQAGMLFHSECVLEGQKPTLDYSKSGLAVSY